MATQVQYQAPQLNSSSVKVSYYLNSNVNVINPGILVTTTLADEVVSIDLYDLQVNLVVNYTIVNETNSTSTVINNNDDIRLTQNKFTGALVYAKTTVNPNGSVSTAYINMIDGSPYAEDVENLEIFSEAMAATESQIVCVRDGNNATTLTRKDFINSKNQVVGKLWQDLAGNVVAAPSATATISAGSCELDLDVELIERVDNLLDTVTGKITGHFVCFAYASFFSKSGDISLTKALLPDGRTPYAPAGTVTKEPVLPAIVQGIGRIDATNPTFSTDADTVSVALTTEYTDKNGNNIGVKHPAMADALMFNRMGTYQVSYGVNRDDDPCLPNIVFSAIGAKSSAIVSFQTQPPLVEVVPAAPANVGGGGGGLPDIIVPPLD